MVIIKRVTDQTELSGIKKLQDANLKTRISGAEMEQEGFVTSEYTLEFLQMMHESAPSVIAKDGDEVVGYALVATRSAGKHHKLLAGLVKEIDLKMYKGKKLADSEYILIGQLCVSKLYRRQGLVQKMYAFYRRELSPAYDYGLTDVDEKNPRSLKAHLKSGFTILDTLMYEGSTWHIVIWDWTV
jgi:hypothetical protein